MEKHEYARMFEVEDAFWWYKGLHELVLSDINRIQGNSRLKILDAGSGTGRLLELIGGENSFGFDFSRQAIDFQKKRNLKSLCCASISKMPFKAGEFDIITSMDVLYHKAVSDDAKALSELACSLKKGGYLILNLPAFEFLKSRHDEAVHTARRYTKGGLKAKLAHAGFGIEKMTYRNSFLFPAAFILRMIKKNTGNHEKEIKSELEMPLKPINAILLAILRLENRATANGFKFPFGLSVYCVARKK